MKTEYFLMVLDGNDCVHCSLDSTWRNHIYYNPKTDRYAPVPRDENIDDELVEFICISLGIDVPSDIQANLDKLRSQK